MRQQDAVALLLPLPADVLLFPPLAVALLHLALTVVVRP